MKTSNTLVALIESLTGTTTIIQPRLHWMLAGVLVHQDGNNLVARVRVNKFGTRPLAIHSDQSRVRVLINDNYCVSQPCGCVEIVESPETFVDSCQTLNVNCFAVNHVPFVAGQPQKKGLNPVVKQLKYVKDLFG